MKKTPIFSFFGMFVLLCLSLLARGQTPITIYGDFSVCKGDTATYSVIPTAGVSYHWSPSVHGNVSALASSNATVTWLGIGSATIKVYGTDNTGDTVEIGTAGVTVHALPVPYISTNSRVGCQQLAGDTIKKGEQPRYFPPEILDDANGCVRVCEYSYVTYYGHDAPGTTYTWDVTGEVSFADMGDSCIVNWGPTGPGTVTVTATNVNGCKASKTICINIIDKPKAIFYTLPDSTYNTRFTGNMITICLGDNVMFVDQSTGTTGSPIMSSYWNFGDLTPTITNASPTPVSHVFNTPGVYTVMLVATNACNCHDTAYVKVKVDPSPGVKITCPSVVCENDTAGYKVNGVTCSNFLWDVRGGTILDIPPYTDSITILWDNVDTTGFGYVIFDAANCAVPCPGKTILKIPVIKQNGHIVGPQIVCPNKEYIYRLPQWPTTDFTWSVVSGTGATISLTDQRNEVVINTMNPGPITLNVSYTNTMLGCGGTASINIQVQPPVTLNGPDKGCHKNGGNWSLSGGTLGNWVMTFPDNSTQILNNSNTFSTTFSMTGNYTLAVTGAFCGPDPLHIQINQLPAPPDSLLGPTVACGGVPTMYTAKNPIPGTIFAWKAYAGTTSGSTGNNSYVNFTGAGPWVISVRRQETTGAYCKSDSIKMTVQPPVPNLVITGRDTVCASSYEYYNLSYADGEVYDWSIVGPGLGTVDSGNGGQGIKVLWNNVSSPGQAGYLIVKVRKCFGYYYDTLNVYVVPTITLNITVSDSVICSGDNVTFTVNSNIPIFSNTGISWDFDDGNTATGGLSQVHTYSITGVNDAIFNATVLISDPNGCADATGMAPDVQVKPAPVAQVSPGSFVYCTPSPFPVHLVATVNAGLGFTANYAWSPSGPTGAIDSTWDITSDGSYSCTVTSSNGCTATSNVVTIQQNCVTPCGPGNEPTFTISGSVTACGHIHVNASATTGFTSGWRWPANAISPLPAPNDLDVDFDVAGNYQFTYYVYYINTTGDTCYADTTISIVMPYYEELFYNINCVNGTGYTVTLQDNSNYYPGVVLNHQYFLDWSTIPAASTATSVSTVVTPGPHTISQVISWGGYPACTVTHNIVIDPLPVAQFTITNPMPACEDWVAVNFNNTSIPSPSLLTNFWNFGDGATNSQEQVSRVYTSAGVYPVTLTVTNDWGCSDTKLTNVNIVTNTLIGTLQSLPNFPCQGDAVTISYVPGAGTYPSLYTWYEQDDVLYANVPNSFITVYEPGGYWMHGTNVFGCVINTPFDTVSITQVPPAVITGDSSQCVDAPYSLNGFAGDDIVDYVWIRDGVTVLSGNTPTLDDEEFPSPGTHTYRLVVKVPNPGGGFCTDTSDPFIVVINPLPSAPYASFSMVDCDDYSVQLSASASGPGTFTWSNGQYGTPIVVSLGGPYKVWFTDINGCRNGTNLNVPKDPKTYLWVFPAGCYTFCKDDLPFTILGPNYLTNWVNWQWLHNGAPSLAGGGPVTSYVVTMPGTYNLLLNNGYCQATSDDMDLSVIDCKDGPCDKITMHIDKVLNADGTPAAMSDADAAKAAAAPAPNPCTKQFIITFTNAYGPGNFSISATNGTLTPPSGSLPVGTTTSAFVFTPNSGFLGGWVYVHSSVYFPDGTKCNYVDSVYVTCKGGKGSLVVTEMSNGPDGKNCEYAEMVVVNCTGVQDKFVDVRGWIMDDNSGNFNTNGCVNGVGITSGHYRLTYESIWSAVPVGSVIVIYNHDENCYNLPNNFTIQNMGATNIYWIPIGGTPSAPYGTPHVERYDKLPMVGNCRYCTADGNQYQVANSWTKTIGFDDVMDAFQVRCPGCTSLNPMEPAFYHGFGYGKQGTYASIPATTNNLGGPVHFTTGAGARFEFIGSTKPDLGNPTMWKKYAAGPAGTPPPSVGYINAGLTASIQANNLKLPCCDINSSPKNGGDSGDKIGGVDETSSVNGIRVYPNPASSILNVEFPASQKATIRIVDIQGRVIATQELTNTGKTTFNVSGFNPGLYMYQVITDNMTQSGKVFISK